MRKVFVFLIALAILAIIAYNNRHLMHAQDTHPEKTTKDQTIAEPQEAQLTSSVVTPDTSSGADSEPAEITATTEDDANERMDMETCDESTGRRLVLWLRDHMNYITTHGHSHAETSSDIIDTDWVDSARGSIPIPCRLRVPVNEDLRQHLLTKPDSEKRSQRFCTVDIAGLKTSAVTVNKIDTNSDDTAAKIVADVQWFLYISDRSRVNCDPYEEGASPLRMMACPYPTEAAANEASESLKAIISTCCGGKKASFDGEAGSGFSTSAP